MVEINRGARGRRMLHTITDRWYPHRHDVIAGNSPESPNASLQSAETVRGAALFVCSDAVGEDGRPAEILNKLPRYHGRQLAGQFPPALARDLYLKHAPPGGRVLDPCAGWGGRLIGWLTARRGGRYVGFDASAASVRSAEAMIAELGIEGASVQLGAYEDQQLEPKSFDFAFTSPPYFDLEAYSADATQSTARYPKYPLWRDGFLEPFIAKTIAALKPGARFVINISDAGKYELGADTIAIAKRIGAELESATKVDVGVYSNAAFSAGATEDLIVLRRPS
jgi:methylase of polypeptide subunit release factors